MWIQIVFSIILAAAALQFIFFAARHEMVPVLNAHEDFMVRYPRVVFWTALVLFALAASLVLSMIVWRRTDAFSILASALLLAVAIYALLLACVWRIDVKENYLICVSALAVKRIVHYDDIETTVITKYFISIKTPVKTFQMSNRVIYGENLLSRLAEHHVPIDRR